MCHNISSTSARLRECRYFTARQKIKNIHIEAPDDKVEDLVAKRHLQMAHKFALMIRK